MPPKDISKLNLKETKQQINETEDKLRKLINHLRKLEKKTDKQVIEAWLKTVFYKEKDDLKFFHDYVLRYCEATDFVCTQEDDGYECIVRNDFLKRKYGITGFRDVQHGQHFFIDGTSFGKYKDFKDIETLSIEELKKLLLVGDFSKFKEEMTAYLLVEGIANESENEVNELYEKDTTFTF